MCFFEVSSGRAADDDQKLRFRRETFEEHLYQVAPYGQDIPECLENLQCKTIEYILKNECKSNRHLTIQVVPHVNFIYEENCIINKTADDMEDFYGNKFYPCRLKVESRDPKNRPLVACKFKDEDSASVENATFVHGTINMISAFLVLDEPSKECTSTTQRDQCTPKLTMKNIILQNFYIVYRGGHQVSATNVAFQNTEIEVQGDLLNSCIFHCDDCSLAQSSDRKYLMRFRDCRRVDVHLRKTSFLSAGFFVSFLMSARLDLNQVTLSGGSEAEQSGGGRGSQFVIQQVEAKNSLDFTQITSISANELRVIDNHIKFGDTDFNAAFVIHLRSKNNPKSSLVIENSWCERSSTLLDYFVHHVNYSSYTKRDEVDNSVRLRNVNLKENIGGFHLMRLVSYSKLFVTLEDCNLFNNTLKLPVSGSVSDPAGESLQVTSPLSVHINEGAVQVRASVFDSNSGDLGGVLYYKTFYYFVSFLEVVDSNFVNNTAEQTSGRGGVFYLQSGVLNVLLDNCSFQNNFADNSGGVVYLLSFVPQETSQVPVTTTSAPGTWFLTPAPAGSGATTSKPHTGKGGAACPSDRNSWTARCIPGPPGPAGISGKPGYAGSTGPRGLQGMKGLTGATGATGATGDHGQKNTNLVRKKRQAVWEEVPCPASREYDCTRCFKGPQGNLGPPGYFGPSGPTGPSGRRGDRGPKGERGPPGMKGDPGEDYVVSSTRRKRQAAVFDCSSYMGEKGPRGPQGPPGLSGPEGPKGVLGPPGERGAKGQKGMKGLPWYYNGSYAQNDTNTRDAGLSDLRIKFNFSSCQFFDNRANIYGGVVMLEDLPGQFVFDQNEVLYENNQAGEGGAAIGISGSGYTDGVWKGCRFVHNKVSSDGLRTALYTLRKGGAVLYSRQAIKSLTLKDGEIRNQFADLMNGVQGKSYGGSIDIANDIADGLWLENMRINDNSVNGSGTGVLHLETNYPANEFTVKIFVIKCTVFNNAAGFGGGSGFLSVFFKPIASTARSEHTGFKLVLVFEDSQISDHHCRENSQCDSAISVNFQTGGGSGGSSEQVEVKLTSSIFSTNTGKKGGAFSAHLDTGANCTVSISKCRFLANHARKGGGALNIDAPVNGIAASSTFFLSLLDVVFEGNVVQSVASDNGNGGAMDLESKRPIVAEMNNIMCKNNTSEGHGGAMALSIDVSNSTVIIRNSQFESNSAGKINQGGALYVYFPVQSSAVSTFSPEVKLLSCSFVQSLAAQGGSVFEDSSEPIGGFLLIEHVSFFCCDQQKEKSLSQNGSLVFTRMTTHMSNVTFQDVTNLKNSICAVAGLVLDHTEMPHQLDNVRYKCYDSKVFAQVDTAKHSENKSTEEVTEKPLDSLMLFCTQCTYQPYTAGNGTLSINLSSALEADQRLNIDECPLGAIPEDALCRGYSHHFFSKSPCFQCPFGGDCSSGRVQARPNYWGFDNNGKIMFQSCPIGYCCNGIDIPCEEHNTCALHREGRLCGGCNSGYTESLMSRTCVPNAECHDWWIWPASVFLAVSYLVWYMYKGQVAPTFEYLMVKLFSYQSVPRNVIHVKEAPKRPDSRLKEPAEPVEDDIPKQRVDKGYFDIIVYFVNIVSLLKVKVEFRSGTIGDGFLYDIEKYFTRYLDVDMQQVANVTVCPFSGVNAELKYLTRPIFVLMILCVWMTLYFVSSLLLKLSERKDKVTRMCNTMTKFKLKLVEGYVETMKYSYSGLAGVTFIYLTCVDVGESEFWKYNAEVQCMSSWQYGVICFAIIYTVPFSFTTILGGKLLQKGQIGYLQFMIACFLPLPFLVYWLISFVIFKNQLLNRKLSMKALAQPTKSLMMGQVQAIQEEPLLSEKARVILETYQGPYKDENASWEGVIELRKLLFNTYYLIDNNIYRLTLCTFTAVIVLVHHNAIMPFKNANSNRTETLSLALLCMVCVTNSIKTVFTESGILVEPNTPTEQLLYLMNRLDRIMILVLLGYVICTEVYFSVKRLKVKKLQ